MCGPVISPSPLRLLLKPRESAFARLRDLRNVNGVLQFASFDLCFRKEFGTQTFKAVFEYQNTSKDCLEAWLFLRWSQKPFEDHSSLKNDFLRPF